MPINSNISLLLVENDRIALELCRKVIENFFPKMVIHTAEDPDEALVKYKDYKHEVVISDIFYPRKDGIKIARTICELYQTTVIIFITGDTDTTWNALKPVAKKLCLEALIHKPIDIRELIKNIKEAIVKLGLNKTEN